MAAQNEHNTDHDVAIDEHAVDVHATDSDALIHASTEIPHIDESDVLGNLGIDGTLFVAQLINFLIVLAVLWFFAYKPFMKLMADRTKKIEDGIKRADEIDERMAALEAEREEVLAKARVEAKGIVDEAEDIAKKRGEALVANARQEVESVVNTGKKQIAAQKDQLMQESKKELADIVVAAVAKVASEVSDKQKAESVAASAIEDIMKDV